MDANRTSPAYELKDPLARLCLPAAGREADLKLAWVNSVCILFLLIGLIGARRGLIAIKPVPPVEEIIPVVIQPMTLPPQETQKKEQPKEEKPDVLAVVVTLPTPSINFAVPTIGTLAVPAALATAPPLNPMETATQIGMVGSTGMTGDRPQPPYPKIALEEAEQGTVRLTLGSDAAGNVASVDVKESSGFPVLDHAAVDFVRRHWRLPAGTGCRLFETSIIYQLQLN